MINSLVIHNGFVSHVIGYSCRVSISEYSQWQNELELNRPLTPEIAGILMGRAKAVYENIECAVCKNYISENDSIRMGNGLVGGHRKCYEDAEKKEGKLA